MLFVSFHLKLLHLHIYYFQLSLKRWNVKTEDKMLGFLQRNLAFCHHRKLCAIYRDAEIGPREIMLPYSHSNSPIFKCDKAYSNIIKAEDSNGTWGVITDSN